MPLERVVKIEVQIPPLNPSENGWFPNARFKLLLEGDRVLVTAPCGAEYGYILTKDLTEALRALSLTEEEKKQLGVA